MPLPIIERQRALSRVGEIRTGGEKPERGAGRKLETFRLTSQHHDVIERCAGLYGGAPAQWQSPNGEAWQLYTESSALPCLVIVAYSLKLQYERWEGVTKCTRRCDGEEEQITGGPCVCNAQGLEGKDACQIVTRLMVVLHETGSSLGWSLRSVGENAARELGGAMMVAEELARGRAFVPATLRLTQRRSVVDGQTVRFVVPVLDFNLAAEAQAVAVPPPAPVLEYQPAPARELPVTAAAALAAASSPSARIETARSAAPIVSADDVVFGDAPVPVPVPDDAAPEPVAAPAAKWTAATQAQKKKLDVLVGTLRDREQKITTENLYSAVAKERRFDVHAMLALLEGEDEQGMWHWAPLRDSLSKQEAGGLIDRLEKKAAA